MWETLLYLHVHKNNTETTVSERLSEDAVLGKGGGYTVYHILGGEGGHSTGPHGGVVRCTEIHTGKHTLRFP